LCAFLSREQYLLLTVSICQIALFLLSCMVFIQPKAASCNKPVIYIQTLVVPLVLSRLEYDNTTLTGIRVYVPRRLHSALNAASRLTVDLPRSIDAHQHDVGHVAFTVFMPTTATNKFKLATMQRSSRLCSSLPFCLSNSSSRRLLRLSSTNDHIVLSFSPCRRRCSRISGLTCETVSPAISLHRSPSELSLRRQISTFLFCSSHPDFRWYR